VAGERSAAHWVSLGLIARYGRRVGTACRSASGSPGQLGGNPPALALV
jgi:hypothetical protein